MFDSHAHVMFPSLDADREAVMSRAREAGLWGWMEVGVDGAQSRRAIALAEKEDGVYASVGVHPDDIAGLHETAWQEMMALASHSKVKAIGEVGLDFYRDGKLAEQLPVLKRFITLAQEKKLPVIFHVRDGLEINAHEELLKLLASYSAAERPRGVIHTYSGTLIQAKQYLDFGLHLSFSGVLTFKHAGELVEVAKMIPADKMLVETDSPFLAPVPYRGKQNEPAYVKLVAEKLAEIRGVSFSEIEKQTDTNAKVLFKI